MSEPLTIRRRGRAAWRLAVPVGIAAACVAGIAYGPSAFADDSDPKLPQLTAEQVIGKMAAAKASTLSGDVKISSDLGLPALPGAGGVDPQALISGTHELHVAVDGPDRQRIGITGELAEYTVIHNGADVWTYDSRNHTYSRGSSASTIDFPAVPQDAAKKFLDFAGQSTDISVTGTSKVAGRDTYDLTAKPKQGGSLIGATTVNVDAATGVPLKVTVNTSKGGKPALEIGFTKVSFDKPGADKFTFTPPPGAKEKKKEEAPKKGGGMPTGLNSVLPDLKSGGKLHGEGWTTVVELPKGSVPAGDRFLNKLGKPVSGGHLFTTRVATVLVTDDGRVLAGAVDGDTLVRTAGLK